MADKSLIHRVGLELQDLDRGLTESLTIRLAQHPSETLPRCALRLLAYALCYHPDLTFGAGLCKGEEPALALHDLSGDRFHWIDVGAVDPERIQRACRHARQVTLLAGGQAEDWWVKHGDGLNAFTNFHLWGMTPEFCEQVTAVFSAPSGWTLTRSQDHLYLGHPQHSFDSPLVCLHGDPLPPREPA